MNNNKTRDALPPINFTVLAEALLQMADIVVPDWLPGGVRKGASGHDICFIHPKASDEFPIGGEGVLIELVQAPAEVVAAHPRAA